MSDRTGDEPIDKRRVIDAQSDSRAGDEDQVDRAIRPRCLADYLGQNKVKEQMRVFIAAAKQRGEALDHLLIFGPPGLGKTTLASVVAHELGVEMRYTSGPVLDKAGDLAALLTNLQPRDILFIDEIHRLSATVEEILYPAMEDYQIDLMIGEGPSARSIKLDLPPFTLVGATTRSGLLTSPLLGRFGIIQHLEFYSSSELSAIVQRSARILGVTIEPEGALEIARRSRGTPRIANRLLRRVRDFAQVQSNGIITRQIADQALVLLGIDTEGFDALDQKFLATIIDSFGGGPVGVETLAASIGEERDTVEEVIEPYLLQQGFIQRTPRGRVAALAAYRHLGRTPRQVDSCCDANGTLGGQQESLLL